MITTTNIPPKVIQRFNKALLHCYSSPKELRARYQKQVERKYKRDGKKWHEYEQLMQVYEEMYGWFEKKKAYERSENKEAQERPAFPNFAEFKGNAKLDKIYAAFCQWAVY